MEKSIKLTVHDGNVSVESNLEGQELYEVYVGMTLHIMTMLKNKNDIHSMSRSAVKDAIEILNSYDSTVKN